ncbi:MAG TPA: glycosyltransferase family 39 protein [Pirellulales bacterium]
MDFRRQLSTVAALMLLACLVQAWMIWRAVVPAQDCVRYLVVAQSFARDGATATLRSQGEQPLFPALVWLTHGILSVAGWIDTANWAVALQVAAAIPLVLSVAPVYLLFQRLHGDRAALAATVLYCLLGGVSRLGADGLSDSTHLVFFMVALWCVARYFSPPEFGSPGWLLASGLSTGLALTARCESLVLPVALLATFGWLACSGPKRPTWRQTTIGAASLSLGLALVLLPFLAWCDALSPRAALARLMGRAGAGEAAPLNDFRPGSRADVTEPRWELPGMGRLVFGKKDTSTSSRFHGYLSAAAKLLHELAQTLHYWLGALALVGLAARWRQLATPLDRFMQCLCAMLIAAGIMVAARAGYLSTRHVLLVVVLALGWAGYGSLTLADWLIARGRWPEVEWRRRLANAALALTVIVACGADCRAALHASREAHRQAARWLSEHANPTAAVLDSRGWTALYTGRKTYRYEAAQAAFTDSALRYVVVEQAELAAGSRRSETMRLLMNHAGEPVARFTAAGSDKHNVVVYRWQPEHFQQLGVQSYAR